MQSGLICFFEAQYNDARAVRPNLTDPRDIYQNMDWWIFNSFGGPTLDESDIDPETVAPTIYRGYKLFKCASFRSNSDIA